MLSQLQRSYESKTKFIMSQEKVRLPVFAMLEEDLQKMKLNIPGKHKFDRIPGSRWNMQSYILTYPRLHKGNL